MKKFTISLLFIISVMSNISLFAQNPQDYVFSSTTGTYTPITGGTMLINGLSTMDSWASTAITIPSFNFCGVSYTTAYVTSNGQLTLGGTAPSTATYTGISTGVGSGICICPFSADLNRAATAATSEIRWETIGNEIVFQWQQITRYAAAENFDMQVRLNTVNGNISFVYQLNSGPGTSTSYQPQVGIRTSATNYSNRLVGAGTENWGTSLNGATNTSTCRFTGTAPIKNFTSGLTYTWTSPTCFSPTTLSVTGITMNGGNLSWVAPTLGTPLGYQWKIVAQGAGSGGTAVQSGNTTHPTVTATASGLSSSTAYDLYVRTDCGGADYSNWAGPFTFTTACGPITAPYSQNFDGVTTPNLPACWSKIVVFPTGTPTVQTVNSTSSSSPNCAQLFNSTSANSSTHLLLITPQFSDLPSHTTQIRFKAKFTGTGTPLLHVGTMSDPANQATFTAYQSLMTLTTAWQEFIVPFNGYAGTNQYIAFKHGYGTTLQYIYIDDVVYETIPSCPQPGSFAVSNITENSANFNWTPVGTETLWNIQYGPTGFTLGTGTTIPGITAHPYTLTGLTPVTGYSCYVQADCGGGDVSTWVGPLNFSTPQVPATLPYVQGFETAFNGEIANGTQVNKWIVGNLASAAHTGTGAAFISNDNGVSNAFTTSSTSVVHLYRDILFTAGAPAYNLSFWWKAQGESTYDYLTVYLVDPSTTPVAGTALTTGVIGANIYNLQGTWQNVNIQIPNTVAGTIKRLVFTWRNDASGGTQPPVSIDDINLTILTCPAPTTLTATGITTNSANLGWTESGAATAWDIQYGIQGFTLGTGTIVAGLTANPHTLSGLNASTNYSFYVRSVCGAGDTSSWSGPFNFSTLCGIISTFPWLEQMNTYVPLCWSETTGQLLPTTVVAGTTSNWIADGYANVGTTGAARLEVWSTGLYAWVMTPQIDLGPGTTPYQLEFDLALTAWGSTANPGLTGTDDKFAVVISTDGGTTWTSANTLRKWDNAGSTYVYNSLTPAGTHVIIPLTSYTGVIKIGFYGESTISNADNDIFIDNVRIIVQPLCPQPLNLSASNITSTSADLAWIAGGSETSWDIQYGTSGFTLGTGTIINNVTNPYTISGLNPSTTYQYYVLSQCSPTDSSMWSGPYSFNTACGVMNAPVAEHFNTTTIPNCWTMAGPQTWLFTTTWPAYAMAGLVEHTGNSGSFAGVDGSGSVSLTGINLLTPFINTSALTTPQVRFFLFNNNTNNADYQTLSVDVYDGATWNNGMYIWGPTQNSTSWQEITIPLNTLTITGPIQVRFSVAKSAGSPFYDDMVIDDFYVEEAPTCLKPTALTATNVLDVSADLGWTANTGETMWDIQYGPTGFTLGTGTIINNVTTNPYHLIGLTATTSYQFYVMAQCSPTDSSIWAGPFSFTTQLTICSGIPTVGTVTSSVNPVCPGVNFNLIVSGYTVAGGINFQWQSSVDGITYANVGTNNDTISINQSVETFYQCIVTCVGSGLFDTTVVFTENINPFTNCYCTSNATSTADEEIFNVTVGTLNNSSTCATVAGPGSILNEYSNYTTLPAPDLSRSTAVNFSVEVNTCGTSNYNSGLAIFIDFNQNGLFTDPGERVYSNGAAADITCVPSTILTGTFTVPLTAVLGNTRMRVVDAESISGNTINPCGTYGYGETEDYLVNIVAAPSCIQPSALSAANVLDISADLSWTSNSSETAWDIQYGPTGFTIGTGTIINDVASNPYTLTGLNSFTTYQYYVLAQCSPTDSSAWSGPYSFTTLLSACSGTPNPGTVASSMNPVCPSTNFTLTLSGSSVASGLTYQWQSSADGITFADIVGETNDTLVTLITDTMYYQCIVTCTASGSSDVTPVFQENLSSFYGCYCASNATSTADEEIFNVTVATLNNSSTCATTGGPGSILNEYSNYTAIPAPVLGQSTTVSFSVQIGTCGGNYGNGIAIFIDFNQNGLFTDTGEKVYFSATSTTGPHIESGSISIPLTATLGLTGMRVVSVETGTPSTIVPCGTYTWGETEDYLVNIVPAPTCIQPTTLTAANVTANSVDLGWTAVNGETSWDIQYGPSGFLLGTGTILQNITTNPYTLSGLAAATTYQFYVSGQCSPTDSSFWSGPFTFTTLCGVLIPDYYQPFTAYLPNCWTEATGQLAAPTTFTSPTTSNWNQDGFGNVGTTGAAGVNIYSTLHYDWLISPEIDLGTSGEYQVEFDLALTAYASTGNPGTTGTDDKFVVVISTDAGLTWSDVNTLRIWDNAGSPYVYNSIPPAGTHVSIPLTSYTGVVKIGLYGESTVSNADNDLFVDNFRVRKPVDLAIVSPTDGTHNSCGLSGSEPVTICIKNVGVTTILSGAVIYTWYKVNPNPSVADTLTLNADLLPNDSVFFTFTQPADFSAITSYLVNYWIDYSEDISTANDTSYTTLVNYTLYVNILGGDTVLVDPVFMPYTLSVQASPFTYNTYLWSNATGTATGTTSTFDTPDFGWYYLTVTDDACTATDSIFVGNITNLNNSSLSNNVSVYPNPTDGKFNVYISNNTKSDYSLELYTSEGKKVYEKTYKNTSEISEFIDGSKLAEGLYSLKVSSNGKLEIFKVAIY